MYDTITLRPEKRLGLKISLDSCLFLSHHHRLLHHHLPSFSNMITGHFVGAGETWARSSMDTKVIIDREVWGPRETSLSIDIHWPLYWFSITWKRHREIRREIEIWSDFSLFMHVFFDVRIFGYSLQVCQQETQMARKKKIQSRERLESWREFFIICSSKMPGMASKKEQRRW